MYLHPKLREIDAVPMTPQLPDEKSVSGYRFCVLLCVCARARMSLCVCGRTRARVFVGVCVCV